VPAGAVVDGLTSGILPVLAMLLVAVYGSAAAWLMGIRDWLVLFASSPAVGFGLLLLGAEVSGVLGMAASPAVVGGTGLLPPLGIALVRASLGRSRVASRVYGQAPSVVWLGALVGAVAGCAVWFAGIRHFEMPPQHIDDIFHGYVAERLTHVHTITSTSVVPLFADSAEPSAYYPYGLHLAVALVGKITGIGVVPLLNGAWVAFAAVLLALGNCAFVRAMWPDRSLAPALAGALSPCFVIFPYMVNGVAPYGIGTSLVPAFLAVLVTRLRDGKDVPALVLSTAAVGVFGVHPSAAANALVLGVLLTIEELLRVRSRRTLLLRVLWPAALALVMSLPWIIGLGGVRGAHESGSSVPTFLVTDLNNGIWMALRLGSPWTLGQPLLAIFVLLGIVLSFVRRQGWSIGLAWLGFMALFVGAASASPVSWLTWPWYGLWFRLLAVAGLLTPCLAAVGITWLVSIWTSRPRHSSPLLRTLSAGASAGLLVVALVASLTGLRQPVRYIDADWHARRVITPADQRVFDALREATREGEVLNGFDDGSTWMYAMSGVVPAIPYANSAPARPRLREAFEHLSEVQSRPVLCRALLLHSVTAVVTRPRDIYARAQDSHFALRAGSELFEPLASTPTTAAYLIDRQKLRTCANI
jgi:hypothetical protein